MAGSLCAEASAAAAEGTGSSPPLVVLLRFCSEGDNAPDAIALAQAVNDTLRLLPGGDGGEGSPGGKPWNRIVLFRFCCDTPPFTEIKGPVGCKYQRVTVLTFLYRFRAVLDSCTAAKKQNWYILPQKAGAGGKGSHRPCVYVRTAAMVWDTEVKKKLFVFPPPPPRFFFFFSGLGFVKSFFP